MGKVHISAMFQYTWASPSGTCYVHCKIMFVDEADTVGSQLSEHIGTGWREVVQTKGYLENKYYSGFPGF